MSSRNPHQNLPNEELRTAIFQRLNGNIRRIDGSTVVPVYDEIPEDFRSFDFIEIDALTVTPLDDRSSHYQCEVVVNVYSTYAGYKELSRELKQVNAYLGATLRTMTDFTDVSQGGAFVQVIEVKKISEEGTIVRHGEYRRMWIIADNKR